MQSQMAIEQIAATLAHEIKNPISLVRAYVDLLELEDATEINAKSYIIMRRELDKVSDIMMDFMDLTKPIGNQFEGISLNPFIVNIIEHMKGFSKNRIQFSLEAEPVTILGDKTTLSRVFFNIYKNSCEALTDNGKIHTCVVTDKDNVVITITDNGIGFTKNIKEKLATPFFTTKKTGSGLGIYICKNIIEAHSGTFEIDSVYEKGCTVTLQLPIEQKKDYLTEKKVR